jgi:hypothetical protein
MVLSETGEEMSAKVIRTEVEQILAGSVSRFSIADYFIKRSKSGPAALLENALRALPALALLSSGRLRRAVP